MKLKDKINETEGQNLTQVAAEIQALLEQLEKTYPTNTTLGKVAIAEEAIQRIDNDPQLTTKILSALKAGGTSALDSLLDHPAASFILAAIRRSLALRDRRLARISHRAISKQNIRT